MKLFIFISLIVTTLFSAKVVEVAQRYQDSKSCKACHLRIVNEWEDSWHSKSHYKNDEYFRASLDYVSRKTRKSKNSVKVQCATCHNPRISVTSTDEDYEIAAVMGLDKGGKVDKAVNSDSISEGINCVVCHNIDKIHNEYDASKRGINRVEWTPSGTMTGPYRDAKSPYHKTIHHNFMDKNPNKLCFVCHANDRSVKGVIFTDMESEYKNSSKKCVDCHMGKRKRDIAATYKMYNGEAKMRDVRNHGFMGGHTPSMWVDALDLKLFIKGNNLYVKIINPQPHNIPSGFGSRELLLIVKYKNKDKVIESKKISLTNHYTRKRSKVTIPHLAKKQTKDLSIPAKGSKTIKVGDVKKFDNVDVELYYVLVNKEVRELLKLKGSNWSEKNFITKKSIKLK
jgi:hypothetical protein